MVLAISVLTLAEYLLGMRFGIDQLFFPDPKHHVQTTHPGRMSKAAALAFVFLGTALLLLQLAYRAAQRDARLLALATSLMLLMGFQGLL